MATSSSQATCGSWDFFQPCKILYKPKIHKGCSPCSLWKTKWMYPPLELIHKRCTLSCSQYNNPHVDVPYTCTTKDVPSNELGQRILRQLVLWNLLLKGKGRIKRILRRGPLNSLGKGEERHKVQAISPSFFWQREKWMKKKSSTSFWSMNFSWKRKYWTKTLRKMKRN